MKKLALLALLALSACNSSSSDGYYFEKDSVRLPEKHIVVEVYPSLQALKINYDKNTSKNKTVVQGNRELMAYSVINSTTCTIHMIDPKVRYMPDFFGHELTHCLYGEFHPSQNG